MCAIFLWLAARACRKLRRLWLDIPILLSPSAPHKERKLKPERFKLRLTLEYPKRALVHRRTSLYAGRTRCFQKGGETPLVALGLRERAQLLISAMALFCISDCPTITVVGQRHRRSHPHIHKVHICATLKHLWSCAGYKPSQRRRSCVLNGLCANLEGTGVC